MSRFPAIPARLRRHVFKRANNRCEYCRLPLKVDVAGPAVEHIVARKHRGKSTGSNLAAACSHCNLHKGSDAGGIDPLTGQMCRLFNPRVDGWQKHFRLVGSSISGRTAIGRTTVYVLAMNDEVNLALRQSLIEENLY